MLMKIKMSISTRWLIKETPVMLTKNLVSQSHEENYIIVFFIFFIVNKITEQIETLKIVLVEPSHSSDRSSLQLQHEIEHKLNVSELFVLERFRFFFINFIFFSTEIITFPASKKRFAKHSERKCPRTTCTKSNLKFSKMSCERHV